MLTGGGSGPMCWGSFITEHAGAFEMVQTLKMEAQKVQFCQRKEDFLQVSSGLQIIDY